MEQLLRVNSGENDQEEEGPEYHVHYAVFAVQKEGPPLDHDSFIHYELWEDDDKGNGVFLADFGTSHASKRNAISVCLKLGTFVEWKAGTRKPKE